MFYLAKTYFGQLEKEQVKMLYDKYELDFLMFEYEIEPYLAYAVNLLMPKYPNTSPPPPTKPLPHEWNQNNFVIICYIFIVSYMLIYKVA